MGLHENFILAAAAAAAVGWDLPLLFFPPNFHEAGQLMTVADRADVRAGTPRLLMWVPKPTSSRASRSCRSHTFPTASPASEDQHIQRISGISGNGSADGKNDKRPCENEIGCERHVKTVEAMKRWVNGVPTDCIAPSSFRPNGCCYGYLLLLLLFPCTLLETADL